MKRRLKAVEKTQQDLADALSKDRTVITKMLSGHQPLALSQVKPVARVLEMTEAEVLQKLGLRVKTAEQIMEDGGAPLPLVGIASCGIKGWGKAKKLGNRRSPRPPGLDDPEAFAIIAAGDSMIPDGIRPGFVCICSPNMRPSKGDAVFIERRDKSLSIKQFMGRKDKWVILQGYLPPDEFGIQSPYTERVAKSTISRMAPIVYVRRKA